MKGIPKQMYDHKIELMIDTKPLKQSQYKMNPNYALKVRENMNKLPNVGFIYPIETTQWFSLLVIIPKKNVKLRICVDYWKLNAQTKKDPFPLPFPNLVLDTIIGHDMYFFMDGYKQIKMAKEEKENNAFISKWGAYAYDVMPFGLCNASKTFQKVVTRTFNKYLNEFMQVFLDDFSVFGRNKYHLEQLKNAYKNVTSMG